jgi:hypothetical protein
MYYMDQSAMNNRVQCHIFCVQFFRFWRQEFQKAAVRVRP